MTTIPDDLRIAVILPCFNEEIAISTTINGFRAALPTAEIYVYDNNSTDRTAEVARQCGAIVRAEAMQGKGNVVRRIFANVQADIYVMADGDATYDAASAPLLVSKLVSDQLDMIVGSRVSDDTNAYRRGHQFGNVLLTSILAFIFGRTFNDILSGYRVFSYRFVKSFPVISSGFEIETEMSVHALELRMAVAEVSIPYAARPDGSESKLSTYRDGFRILRMITTLFRVEKPFLFFGTIGIFLALVSVSISIPLAITYAQTGLVPRFPTAILAMGLIIISVLCLFAGLILDTVVRGRLEMRRLFYLSIPPPNCISP